MSADGTEQYRTLDEDDYLHESCKLRRHLQQRVEQLKEKAYNVVDDVESCVSASKRNTVRPFLSSEKRREINLEEEMKEKIDAEMNRKYASFYGQGQSLLSEVTSDANAVVFDWQRATQARVNLVKDTVLKQLRDKRALLADTSWRLQHAIVNPFIVAYHSAVRDKHQQEVATLQAKVADAAHEAQDQIAKTIDTGKEAVREAMHSDAVQTVSKQGTRLLLRLTNNNRFVPASTDDIQTPYGTLHQQNPTTVQSFDHKSNRHHGTISTYSHTSSLLRQAAGLPYASDDNVADNPEGPQEAHQQMSYPLPRLIVMLLPLVGLMLCVAWKDTRYRRGKSRNDRSQE